ncbi:SGNH hydrolase [Pseudovirgaria hyperparasitica]|uniref:SGNH hydrolase n=1 Tax=Pseudovirgaria hyperparasitica TaxID=470096 RepID=A0A6A6WM96_9PEZI|nr:SGNH hydrolase [Pseudovirgaria hyperparasitica]KAF2763282.1 SGNH hydrolase [Pseudovirgaria hyperparasitica]
MAALYDQFILFGDSLTQQGWSQERGFAFLAQLGDDYVRRLDVVNRGFSGYNTTQALAILPRIIPHPNHAKVKLLTIFFGANDASLPHASNNQHVPLQTYTANLRSILTHPSITAHAPHIILITPPPINEHPMAHDPGVAGPARRAACTKAYADAVITLGLEMRVAVLDLWGAVMARVGWDAGGGVGGGEVVLPGSLERAREPVLDGLLHDGLHFSPEGYRVLYEELVGLIAERWPELRPEALPFVLPGWTEFRV